MSRLRLLLTLTVVLATLGVVLVRGLGANLVYYATPTEVLADHQSGADHRLRLGGQVLPGSVARSAHRVSFAVGDGTSQVTVVGAAKLPSMFRPGEGVVVEGYLVGGAGHRTFRADTVLVKHGSDYQPPSTAPTAAAAGAAQAAP